MLEQNRRNGQKGGQGGDQDDDSPQQIQFHNDNDFM